MVPSADQHFGVFLACLCRLCLIRVEFLAYEISEAWHLSRAMGLDLGKGSFDFHWLQKISINNQPLAPLVPRLSPC